MKRGKGFLIVILLIILLIGAFLFVRDRTTLFSSLDPTVQAFLKDPIGTTKDTVDAYNNKIHDAYDGVMDPQ